MFSNPIGWVQVQINGGFRKLFIIGGVYGILVAVILYVAYRGYSIDWDPSVLPRFAGGALLVLTMVELAILFFMSAAAIKKAIQRDFNTNMITSHRNTGITGPVAVWGYLTGPTCQVAMLTAVNFLLCVVLAILARPSVSPLAPLVLLIVFLCPAIMLFNLDVLVGLSTRGAMVVTPIIAMFNIFGAFRLLDLCPGLAVLLFSVDTRQLSQLQSGDALVERLVAMLFQLAFAWTFFLAAARKFTRDDVSGFNETLAFCLLALATLLGAVGFGVHTSSPTPWGSTFFTSLRSQLVATLVPLASVAMIPVAQAARRSTDWLRRRRKDEAFAAKAVRGPRGFVETAIIATIVVFGIFAACNRWLIDDDTRHLLSTTGIPPLVWVVSAFLLALISAGGAFFSTYAREAKAGSTFMLLALVTWIAPIVIEFAYAQFFRGVPRGEVWTLTPVFGCSPVGTWILTICKLDGAVMPGIAFQLIVAAFAWTLAKRAKP